eukprot:m.140226 g.140226  ORF g.140226 m.140226 type:complete len:484 (-) comp13180_c0_seq2:2291-3742(-)
MVCRVRNQHCNAQHMKTGEGKGEGMEEVRVEEMEEARVEEMVEARVFPDKRQHSLHNSPRTEDIRHHTGTMRQECRHWHTCRHTKEGKMEVKEEVKEEVSWEEIIALGQEDGVTDLSQGYPDFPGDEVARTLAAEHVLSQNYGSNQYAPINGVKELREALQRFYKRFYNVDVDAEKEVTVVTSGTEGLYVAKQTLLDEGDEVVIFEPFFPWYLPHTQQAKATPKLVRLKAPDFRITRDALEAAVTPQTKMIVLNSPHNPTGHVLSREELEIVADIAKTNDLIVLSDEVYETVVFDEKEHLRIADIDGMFERTITLGSASKMFSLTGWRVAWWSGPEHLIKKIQGKHKYCSYCAPTPLQHAVAGALDALQVHKAKEVAQLFQNNAHKLASALEKCGLDVYAIEGGYFVIADASKTGLTALEYCRWVAKTKKVACVPLSIFYGPSSTSDKEDNVRSLVRFAICKVESTIDEACEKLLAAPTTPNK